MYSIPANNIQGTISTTAPLTVNLPLGPTYDKIILRPGGTLTTANIQRVVIKANGRQIFDQLGADILAERAYKKLPADSAYMTIDYTEPKARGGAAEQLLATLPSALLKQLTVEVYFTGTLGATPTFAAQVQLRNASRNPFIRKMLPFNQSFAAGGDQQIFLPVGDGGGIVKRIYMFMTNLNRIEVRNNNFTLWESDRLTLEWLQKENDLVPQTGLVALDFVMDGNIGEALNTVQGKDVQLRMNLSAAATIRGYYELIDPINRL